MHVNSLRSSDDSLETIINLQMKFSDFRYN